MTKRILICFDILIRKMKLIIPGKVIFCIFNLIFFCLGVTREKRRRGANRLHLKIVMD